MTTLVALDTSVAVPLLLETHPKHRAVSRWRGERELALGGHAVVETYSVLTRLPGDMRLTAQDAARLIAENFVEPLLLEPEVASRLPQVLSKHGIVGGAAYDALVGLAAVQHGATLATRDERARSTYELVGARVVVVA